MKHKLDEEVEDILQHYGIKGMRWDIRRTQEEIAADAQAGVDAVGEALDSDEAKELRERFGNKFEDILDEVSDTADAALKNVKKRLNNVSGGLMSLGRGLVAKYNKQKRDERDAKYNKKRAYLEGVKIYMEQGRKPSKDEVRKLKRTDFAQERINRERQKVLGKRKKQPTLAELRIAPQVKWQKRNYNKPSVKSQL